MKRYPRPDAIITDRLRSYRAALRELGGSDASRNSPPSILPSTTTSTSDDPSVHGTISNSTAPLHSPSGVSSGRPNSLVLGGITQTCDFTLTVPQILLVWLESWPLLVSRACSFLQFGSLLDLFFSRQGPCRANRRWVGQVQFSRPQHRYASIKRSPLGSGIGSPNSLAVSTQSSIA